MKFLLSLFLVLSTITSCSSSQKPCLYVYTWSDFLDPSIIKKFEQLHDCYVIIDSFDSNETMYTKLLLGATGYDIITPSSYFVEIMYKQNMLKKIDWKKIENFPNIDEKALNLLTKETRDYQLPYFLSTSILGWRSDMLPIQTPSWDIFSNKSLSHRITMLNDTRETIGAALRYLGYSLNSKNPEEIEKAKELVIAWKPNLAKFENEQYKNGLASSEYLVVHGYSSDILQVAEENSKIAFGSPKEGVALSIDSFCIPCESKNEELAYKFLNFLCDSEIAAQNMNKNSVLCPNKEAYPKVREEIRSYLLALLEKQTLENVELIQDIGETIILYNTAWDEIKGSD